MSYTPLTKPGGTPGSGPTGNSPYGSGAPYYAESTGYISPATAPVKKGTSPWLKFGLPLLVLVIIGAVVGGVVGSRSGGGDKSASSSSSNGGGGGGGNSGDASSAVSAKSKMGRYATATNSFYEVPIYPSTTNTAVFTSPTFISSNNAKLAWPKDSFQPSNPDPTQVRPDRPRLLAPAYKWAALPTLIENDPYLKGWNDTIFGNATDYYNAQPVPYYMDGGSGILDNAREVKMRVKAFAYVYRMTNNTKWADRLYKELENAVSDSFGPSGASKWNPTHFLDTAEFTAAFAIAYDWLYDIWTSDQKSMILNSIITYGLNNGVSAFDDPNVYTGWWKTATYGNWNCVCNGGLTLGALAILNDDTTGIAQKILGWTIPSAKGSCVWAPSSDGTWAETANYWYFGTTGHAEMTSALMTATGSDHGMLTTNPAFGLTGVYHMYAYGPTSLFDWGDHGPNKFSSTANSMLLYATAYKHPEFALFQREQKDAAEPWSMFWYDPTVSGAFWDGLALDHFFTNDTDQWGSMRSSWTDVNALYIGVKAGKLVGHQTHGDLDCGDFVLDAMGHRWAGEFGSGNYLSDAFFSNETQTSERWLYYRKRTEGQNTIVVDRQNQLVTASPTIQMGTTNETQGSSTVYTPSGDSTAFFTMDIASAYDNVSSFKRGIRMINGRKQVLLQDDITASKDITWIMHTNATVTIDGTSATLQINDKTMKLDILNAPNGVTITKQEPAQRFDTDPPVPSSSDPKQQAENNDQPNPGVTSIFINLPAGTYNLQVLFSPQWDGMSASDFKTPGFVAIDQWSLTSHN